MKKINQKQAMKALFFDDNKVVITINRKKTAERDTKEYLTKEDYRFLDNEAYKYFLNFTKQHKKFKNYFDYNGLNLLDFVEEEFCFKSVFSYTIKDIVRTIGTISKIIDVEKPYKLIVKDNVSIQNRAALLTAKSKGIKTKIKSSGLLKGIGLFKSNLVSFGYENYLSIQKLWRRLNKKIKQNSNGILFLPYYPNHADVMNPIIKLLKQENENFDVVCVDNVFNAAKKRLNGYNINYEIFEHYTNSRVKRIVKNHKKEFKSRWKELRKNKEAQKAITYKNISLWNLLEPRLKFLFLKRFGQVSEYIETTRHLIAVKKPSIIITTNETSTYGRVACKVANLESVPILDIQHGTIADEPRYSRMFADIKAVEGPEIKKDYLKRDVAAKKIVITGQPRYDALAKKQGIPTKQETYNKLKINPQKKIIVLTTQVPECDEHFIRTAYNAVKDMKDIVLVVKMHPAERTQAMYYRVRKETGIKNIIIGKDIHLYGLLNASELMMTVFSTTALEAMILGTPVLTINLSGEPDIMPYASSGAAFGVYKAEDLKKAINNILTNKKTQQKLKKGSQKFIYNAAYKMDGNANQRVVSLIKKLKK